MSKKSTLTEIESKAQQKLKRRKQLRYVFEVVMTENWPEKTRVTLKDGRLDLSYAPTKEQYLEHCDALSLELMNIKKEYIQEKYIDYKSKIK